MQASYNKRKFIVLSGFYNTLVHELSVPSEKALAAESSLPKKAGGEKMDGQREREKCQQGSGSKQVEGKTPYAVVRQGARDVADRRFGEH